MTVTLRCTANGCGTWLVRETAGRLELNPKVDRRYWEQSFRIHPTGHAFIKCPKCGTVWVGEQVQATHPEGIWLGDFGAWRPLDEDPENH